MKNRNSLMAVTTILFFMGIFLLMGFAGAGLAKGLPADVEKWLKENKIGPFQEKTAMASASITTGF